MRTCTISVLYGWNLANAQFQWSRSWSGTFGIRLWSVWTLQYDVGHNGFYNSIYIRSLVPFRLQRRCTICICCSNGIRNRCYPLSNPCLYCPNVQNRGSWALARKLLSRYQSRVSLHPLFLVSVHLLIISPRSLVAIPIGGQLLKIIGPSNLVAFIGAMLAMSFVCLLGARWACLGYNWKWFITMWEPSRFRFFFGMRRTHTIPSPRAFLYYQNFRPKIQGTYIDLNFKFFFLGTNSYSWSCTSSNTHNESCSDMEMMSWLTPLFQGAKFYWRRHGRTLGVYRKWPITALRITSQPEHHDDAQQRGSGRLTRILLLNHEAEPLPRDFQ
jgi:hypothetical protein